MITKTTLALALVLGTVSLAAASEADPNLLNRYPAYNMTVHGAQALVSRDVGLSSGQTLVTRNVGLSGGYAGNVGKGIPQNYFDRASFSTGQ
jgi:hypothetical protein